MGAVAMGVEGPDNRRDRDDDGAAEPGSSQAVGAGQGGAEAAQRRRRDGIAPDPSIPQQRAGRRGYQARTRGLDTHPDTVSTADTAGTVSPNTANTANTASVVEGVDAQDPGETDEADAAGASDAARPPGALGASCASGGGDADGGGSDQGGSSGGEGSGGGDDRGDGSLPVELAPTDGALLEQMRSGDGTAYERAYEELYRRHAHAVRRYARSCCRDADTADDLTAEVFARTLQAVRGGAGPHTAVRAYLLTTVRRVAATWMKTAKREQLVEDFAVFAASADRPAPNEEGTPGSGFDVGADVRAMHEAEQSLAVQAFRSLPEHYQAVLWHTTVEDEPLRDVAPLLGLTDNAAAVLAHRAREKLKQAYLQAHVNTSQAAGEDCARYADRLGAYARGALRMRAERGLRKHLEDCVKCRMAALEVADVNATLRAALPVAVIGWFAAAYATKAATGGAAGAGAGAAAAAGGAAAAAGGSAGSAAGGLAGSGTGAVGAGGAAAVGSGTGAAGGTAGSGAGGVGGSAGGAAGEGLGSTAKVGIAAGVVVVAGAILAYALSGGSDAPKKPEAKEPTTVVPSTPHSPPPKPGPPPPTPPPAKPPAPAPIAPSPAKPKPKPRPAQQPTQQPTPQPTQQPAPRPTPQPTPPTTQPTPSATPTTPAPEPPPPVPRPTPSSTPTPTPAPTPTARPKPPPTVFQVNRLEYGGVGDGTKPELRLAGSSPIWQRDGLSIGGKRYAHGATMHAPSSVTIDLNRTCVSYEALVGLDDLTYGLGAARFSVYSGSARLWRSGVVRAGQPAVPVRVALAGRTSIRLVVEPHSVLGRVALGDWAESRIGCR
ncbi:sigma-70 family RNA polymerase sigma factor [Streptomyces zagrosensis]|uniref:RNA polymerase sigma factor (Sigma-70 family) n=1 Tax=Streptomyces zagrosensis TaxID=1042984 RepID=A0A7W9UXI2_9ACTN|nr:sigma-70 family RNA polymerase sigma factor [Streptomyces zagrosensis]MBB5933749.1 RNA polymerase sigma factor (sigma-70 family) [Streptomyces zagrosensis]